jgi:hypothetical protein
LHQIAGIFVINMQIAIAGELDGVGILKNIITREEARDRSPDDIIEHDNIVAVGRGGQGDKPWKLV